MVVITAEINSCIPIGIVVRWPARANNFGEGLASRQIDFAELPAHKCCCEVLPGRQAQTVA